MTKYLLTKLDGQVIVTNEDKTHHAQHLRVEEALLDGASLKDMVEDIDDFLLEWIPISQEYGWGEVLEVYESPRGFEVYDVK